MGALIAAAEVRDDAYPVARTAVSLFSPAFGRVYASGSARSFRSAGTGLRITGVLIGLKAFVSYVDNHDSRPNPMAGYVVASAFVVAGTLLDVIRAQQLVRSHNDRVRAAEWSITPMVLSLPRASARPAMGVGLALRF